MRFGRPFNGLHIPSSLFSCRGKQGMRNIEGLFKCVKLVELDLRNNPIQRMPNYRLETIARIATLRVLDGQEITEQERTQARAFLSGTPVDEVASPAVVTAASAVTGIFGEELNEQLKIQEQISAKRKEEDEKRYAASSSLLLATNLMFHHQQGKKTRLLLQR